MKKLIKFGALAIGAALFAISCETVSISIDEVKPEIGSRTITLVYPDQLDSKVSLADDGKTAWETGDQIFIHGAKVGNSGETYYSRTITLAAEDIHDEGKTATFTLDAIDADAGWGRAGYKATLFAAYPASALAAYSNGDYWYYSTPFTTTDTILLAGTNNTSVNDGNTITFMNLTGVLSFVVSGDFDSYQFIGNGGTEVVGYDRFSVRVDTQSSFGDKNIIPYNGGSGGVGYSGAKTMIEGAVVADGSTVNTLYFPGGVNLDSGFTIKFLKGGVEQKRVSTSTAKNIAVGKFLKLGNITGHLYTYVPPAVHNSAISLEGSTDLSSTASANCYIVDGSNPANKDKVFTFKAYKGKSTTNVGTIASASIIWETYNNTEEVDANSVIAAVDFDKQAENDFYTMVFKMPATLKAGNALIAAKNAGGDILWSWHIWVPSTTISNVDGSAILGATVMDRNVGALVATSTDLAEVDVRSTGLIYQWGRKDPFIGLGTWSSSSPATVHGTAPSLGGQFSIAYSIANPTVYGVKSGGDWLDGTDNTRWGATKTIYDPCPPGYRIASGAKGSSAEYPLWNSSNIKTAVTAKDGWTWELSDTYYRMSINDGTNTVAYTLGGYVEDGAGSYTISYRKTRLAVWFFPTNTTSKYHINVRSDESNLLAGSTSAARGCNVRCVVE